MQEKSARCYLFLLNLFIHANRMAQKLSLAFFCTCVHADISQQGALSSLSLTHHWRQDTTGTHVLLTCLRLLSACSWFPSVVSAIPTDLIVQHECFSAWTSTTNKSQLLSDVAHICSDVVCSYLDLGRTDTIRCVMYSLKWVGLVWIRHLLSFGVNTSCYGELRNGWCFHLK